MAGLVKRTHPGLVLALALLAGGCGPVGVYLHETAGISPAKLVPLYFQEKQYVEDRELVARVRGALAAQPMLRGAQIEVDAYLKDVTLKGAFASPEQRAKAVAVAGSVRGVGSVDAQSR